MGPLPGQLLGTDASAFGVPGFLEGDFKHSAFCSSWRGIKDTGLGDICSSRCFPAGIGMNVTSGY